VECTDSDISPSGTLPFLEIYEDAGEKEKHAHEHEHGHVGSPSTSSNSPKTVVTARSILTYLEKLKEEKNGTRGNGEHEEHIESSQRTAWSAFVNTKLRNLFVRDSMCSLNSFFLESIECKLQLTFPFLKYALESRFICEPGKL
jgi:hypothetical protein